jgi:hypothetical protein
MTTMRSRVSLIILALTLTAQLAFAVPSPKIAQNSNSSTTTSNAALKSNKSCKKKCKNTLNKCLSQNKGNRNARNGCYGQYDVCLGYCQ